MRHQFGNFLLSKRSCGVKAFGIKGVQIARGFFRREAADLLRNGGGFGSLLAPDLFKALDQLGVCLHVGAALIFEGVGKLHGSKDGPVGVEAEEFGRPLKVFGSRLFSREEPCFFRLLGKREEGHIRRFAGARD